MAPRWTDESGFTLLEVLVTHGILAVLFGVVSLTMIGVVSGAEETVNAAERAIVQSAVDIHMANYSLAMIAERDTPDFIDAGDEPWADSSLRSMPTHCSYTWTAAGVVTQTGCGSVACSTSYASLGIALAGLWARKRRPNGGGARDFPGGRAGQRTSSQPVVGERGQARRFVATPRLPAALYPSFVPDLYLACIGGVEF
jgi:prepilin-type N-terminal cleavage/methylation domain-containing protein